MIRTLQETRLTTELGLVSCLPENVNNIKQMSNPMKPTSSVTSASTPKPPSKAKKKPVKGKKSSYRKQYKKLKPKLKRLIEEGILLKEKLRRKQDKLIEMSRDIHYILGRLMPYQKKLTQSISSKPRENTAMVHSANITTTSTNAITTMSDQNQLRPHSTVDIPPAPSWEGISSYSSSNMLIDSCKSRLNFCLPPEVERQLASIMSDRPPLTLPDDIFSES